METFTEQPDTTVLIALINSGQVKLDAYLEEVKLLQSKTNNY